MFGLGSFIIQASSVCVFSFLVGFAKMAKEVARLISHSDSSVTHQNSSLSRSVEFTLDLKLKAKNVID